LSKGEASRPFHWEILSFLIFIQALKNLAAWFSTMKEHDVHTVKLLRKGGISARCKRVASVKHFTSKTKVEGCRLTVPHIFINNTSATGYSIHSLITFFAEISISYHSLSSYETVLLHSICMLSRHQHPPRRQCHVSSAKLPTNNHAHE
jgi:hypothetical protein